MQTLSQWLSCFQKAIENMCVTDGSGASLEAEEAFSHLFKLAVSARDKGSTIFLIGNGASCSIASHVGADLAKNGRLRTWAFTDPSLLTAIGNDDGYENTFALPLQRLARAGDILVAISSSGSSSNILKAAETAGGMGIEVVTFSAMQSDNPLRTKGCLNFYVPAQTYGQAESAHAALLHYWIDLHVNEEVVSGITE